MRIRVVGDSYFPADAFREAFAGLARDHDVDFLDVVDDPRWRPASTSERRLTESSGTPRQVIDASAGCAVLVVHGAIVTDDVLAASPNLRLVGCARGGPVNVDLAAASAKGIPVVTTPGKNADAVAELALAFMVMLARRIPEVVRFVEAGGEFGHDNYEGARWFGHDLAGHTLGIVGFGQVGYRVAARARAFAMNIVVYDPYVDSSAIEAAGCRAVDLPTLLRSADFVSLHARASADNRGLIDGAAIATMRRGTYLINTARDVLIDEAAVVDGLRTGQLGGVALDVVSPSPVTGRHPLLEFPNVVIATHIGGATYETLHHAAEMLAAEIDRLLLRQPLVNVANRADLRAAAGSGD